MPPLFLLKGIMLVDQVVLAVLAVTLVLLQVIPIVIVPLHMDQMQGIHLGIEWIQLRIYLGQMMIYSDTHLTVLEIHGLQELHKVCTTYRILTIT